MTDPEKNTEQARREETVTAEAFASFNFEKCIESVAAFEFTSLSSHFSKASKEALEAEDGTAAAALILLNVICSIHFTPEDQSRPWGPMMEWDGKRTAIPSDFRGEQNDVLSTLAPSIRHPALRARISDIAWINNRKLGKTATLAVNAYCECVEQFCMSESANSKGSESKIFYAVDCMQRALQIAYATNKRGVTPERVSKTLLLLYDTTRTENICAAYRKMAQLALYYSQISESDIANHAEQLAERAADQYPIAVQSILEMAAHLHDKLGNHDAKRRCQLGAVNQTLRMREQVSGAGAEAHWIMKALQALRHIADVTEMEEALEPAPKRSE